MKKIVLLFRALLNFGIIVPIHVWAVTFDNAGTSTWISGALNYFVLVGIGLGIAHVIYKALVIQYGKSQETWMDLLSLIAIWVVVLLVVYFVSQVGSDIKAKVPSIS